MSVQCSPVVKNFQGSEGSGADWVENWVLDVDISHGFNLYAVLFLGEVIKTNVIRRS